MNLKFVNSVVFPEWIERYEEEEMHNIKHIAQGHGRYLKRLSNQDYILKRGIELANSSKYERLSPIQKMIFISNVVFEDDDKVIEVMKKYNWTREKNKALNILISKIKMEQNKNCEISLDLSLIEEIKHISCVYYGIQNPAVLINRLNELSVTKKQELNHIKKY